MPVGLLGLQTKISRVRSVIASAIASRSCTSPGVSGTRTAVAPLICVTIGYASKDRQAKITSSPGPAVDWSNCWATPTEPVPVARWEAGTPKRSESSFTRPVHAMSG
ncbi:hypothetical protein SAURM35S_06588 [Streptomyces aurantiogriseus]